MSALKQVENEPRIQAASFAGPSHLAGELNHRMGNGPLPVWIVFKRSSMRVTQENVGATIRGLRMAAEMQGDSEE